jgi:hypothetical protein
MKKLNTTQRLRKKREQLYSEDPHCHWCGTLTVQLKGHVSKPPENAATIDHLIHQWHDRRKQNKCAPNEKRYVLACRKCNMQRGLVEGFLRKNIW